MGPGLRMKTVLMILLIFMLAGCGSSVSPPFFNYQDCKKQMTSKYLAKGDSETKATMEARAHCRELYNQ